jgi:hypothetical protein
MKALGIIILSFLLLATVGVGAQDETTNAQGDADTLDEQDIGTVEIDVFDLTARIISQDGLSGRFEQVDGENDLYLLYIDAPSIGNALSVDTVLLVTEQVNLSQLLNDWGMLEAQSVQARITIADVSVSMFLSSPVVSGDSIAYKAQVNGISNVDLDTEKVTMPNLFTNASLVMAFSLGFEEALFSNSVGNDVRFSSCGNSLNERRGLIGTIERIVDGRIRVSEPRNVYIRSYLNRIRRIEAVMEENNCFFTVYELGG